MQRPESVFVHYFSPIFDCDLRRNVNSKEFNKILWETLWRGHQVTSPCLNINLTAVSSCKTARRDIIPQLFTRIYLPSLQVFALFVFGDLWCDLGKQWAVKFDWIESDNPNKEWRRSAADKIGIFWFCIRSFHRAGSSLNSNEVEVQ